MTIRMARTRWLKYSRILLVGSALTTGPVFAAAFAADGRTQSDVEINWGLLDRLGQESTLPQLLLRDEGKDTMAIPPGPSPSVQFRPYRSGDGSGAKEASPPKASPPHVSPAPSRSSAPASGGPVYRTYEPKVQPKAKPESTPAPKPSVTPPPVAKPAPVEKPVPVEKVGKAAPLPVIPLPSPKAETPRPVEPPPAVVPSPVVIPPVVTPKVEPPKVEVPKAALPPVAVPKVEAPTVTVPKVEPPPVVLPAVTLPAVTSPKAEVPSVVPPEPDVSAPAAPVPTPPASTLPEPDVSAPAVDEPAVTPTPAAPSSSVPSSSAARVDGNMLIVAFSADEATISDAAKPLLNELAERLSKDEGLSIQFLAYAGGDEAQASKARRLSLTRALTVRQFFLDRGVRSTRMEVRAMGNRGATNRSPVDRVEIVVVSR